VNRLALSSIAIFSGVLAACGGGGAPSGPSAPVPTPTPVPGHPVNGVVFYDENANGQIDPDEGVRMPSVAVDLGGRTGESEAGGRLVVADVPVGSHNAAIEAPSLPPYFVPGSRPSVLVPQPNGTEVGVPVTLPIGNNQPNVYLGFGDSLTVGEGSSHARGYLVPLREELVAYWGEARIEGDGISGTKSVQGLDRLPAALHHVRPAYTLILYGTNDWNRLDCKDERFPCFTIASLRTMIQAVRSIQGLPVVSTIIPANPAVVDRQGPERNEWVVRMNDLIRPMVREEGAVLADPHALVLEQPSLEDLFVDHVHPNDDGYRLIARAFFEALTGTGETAAASFSGGTGGFGPASASPYLLPLEPPGGLPGGPDGAFGVSPASPARR
jgi:lysophospholipase L1-like esterase